MKTRSVALAITSILLTIGCGHAADDTQAAESEARRAPAAQPSPQAKTIEKPAANKAAPVAVKETAPKADCDCKGEEEKAKADDPIVKVDLGSAPVRGHARAPVTVVVFTDFECPFCARAEATVQELTKKYGTRIKVAFKSNPLPFHEHARAASRAALAAGEQGKFWEYHDALFTHQNELDRAGLERRATELGLDLGKFRAALDADRTGSAVEADVAEGTRLGVTGTPTFFINGRRLVGAQPLPKFEAAIDEALAHRD